MRKLWAMKGLAAKGGRGVNELYDRYVASKELMEVVDALNLNVSDQNDGYGGMDGSFVSSVWGNYELVRNKLDKSGYHHKSVLAAESWVSWDDGGAAVDVNGDGIKNEKDALIVRSQLLETVWSEVLTQFSCPGQIIRAVGRWV